MIVIIWALMENEEIGYNISIGNNTDYNVKDRKP